MKHLFIPYALALILKQKGFQEHCFGSYYTNPSCDEGERLVERYCTYFSLAEFEMLAPLYQQVVDFFRDKHSIYIAVLPFREKSDVSDEYSIELCWYYSLVQDDEDLPDILCNEDDLGAHGDNYATPKEAWDEAFKEALKLI
jgi:hypothetical protein